MNRKVSRLCRLLDINKRQAIGYLAVLWLHAVHEAEDGVLEGYDMDDFNDVLFSTEFGVVEDLGLLGLFEVEERIADLLDLFLAKLTALVTEVLAKWSVPFCGIDQLHLAPAMLGLAIGDHPYVSGDTRVIEHVERQGDDGLEPVVLDDPAADVAFALSGVASEE